MIILSEDFYFKAGIKSILDKNRSSKFNFDMIFDEGNNYIYFFKMPGYIPENDVLTYFLHCERYVLERKSTIDTLQRLFNLKTRCSENQKLTRTEALVFQQFLKERSAAKVAKILLCSEKTISGHKIRALRKLGFNNISIFLKTYNLWCHLLRSHKNSSNSFDLQINN